MTVNNEKHNFEVVKHQLEQNTVDWESVVKIGTSHFVFSALYCNLKRANLLEFLPEDLVEYMDLITQLNRQRNEDIKAQVLELNELLLANNITPIFVKGAGHICQNLYEDLGERMIADIDFVVEKKDYSKAQKVILDSGYTEVDQSKHHSPSFIHQPRIQKEGCVAAVEIHKQVVIEKFVHEFDFDFIKKDIIKVNGVYMLSYNNQLSLAILGNQINDGGFYYRNLTLKNAYDVYLLSKKTNAKSYFENFTRLKYPLDCFLASCYQVFNEVDSLSYNSNKDTEKYLKDFNAYLVDNKKRKKDYKRIQFRLFLMRNHDFVLKTLFHKEYRNWYIKNLLAKLKLKKLAY